MPGSPKGAQALYKFKLPILKPEKLRKNIKHLVSI